MGITLTLAFLTIDLICFKKMSKYIKVLSHKSVQSNDLTRLQDVTPIHLGPDNWVHFILRTFKEP